MSAKPDLMALSGLDQIRLMLEGAIDEPPIAATMGFRLVEVAEGLAVFEGAPTGAMYNPLGTVHGGWIATLLDSACGCAVHTGLRPGQTYTTLELKTAYHRALSAGTPVRSTGKVIQIGRKAAFVEAELRSLDGRLYATATSTCIVLDRTAG